MPLLLIRRPAFLAHLRGLDSISPTVFPAHTFILSELMPVNPTFKRSQKYSRYLFDLFISGNARYLSCAIPFFVIHCFAHVIIAHFYFVSNTARVIFTFENKCYSSCF